MAPRRPSDFTSIAVAVNLQSRVSTPPLHTAMAFFAGDVSPAWAARARRARQFLQEVIGADPPDIPIVPVGQYKPFPFPRMVATSAHRPAALEAAEALFEALARRRFSRLDGLLYDEIWVLWPHGTIGRHPKDALLAMFERRPGRMAPLRIRTRRSYTYSELVATLARGLPELLNPALGLRSALTVVLELESSRGPAGAILLAMAPDAGGRWKARNLPFGSPDDADAASESVAAIEHEAAKVAHKIVRMVVLGHAAQLGAHRNLMMEPFFLRGDMGPVDVLVGRVAEGPHRLGSTEIVFSGSREIPFKELRHHSPPGSLDRLLKLSPDAWGRSLSRMDPILVVTEIGVLDPATLSVIPAKAATSVVVRVEDPASQRCERRLAALFI